MTSGCDSVDGLTEYYDDLVSEFPLATSGDYERLVVPNGNGADPVHRWFKLKEAFSRRLLPRILKDANLDATDPIRVLDPFSGSGTIAASVGDLVLCRELKAATVYGLECNPFLQLVASCKLRALQRPPLDALGLAQRAAAAVLRNRVEPTHVPKLTTFANHKYFAASDLRRLLQLRAAIEEEREAGADPLEVDLALMCLGASIEPVSALRRDGRALRYVSDKSRVDPITEFLRRADMVNEDLPARGLPLKGRVALGDGRNMAGIGRSVERFDLVVFSPPYPNNIDYTEVYKLEAWLLGYIGNQTEFREQRLRTLYSHPSIKRSEVVADPTVRAIIEPVLAAVPDDRYAMNRKLMISGYFNDMHATLLSSYNRLRPGGTLVYVVGNSLHGRGEGQFVIAADVLIAQLAADVGFAVERLEVARQLRRRDATSPHLRETVVFARRKLAGNESDC